MACKVLKPAFLVWLFVHSSVLILTPFRKAREGLKRVWEQGTEDTQLVNNKVLMAYGRQSGSEISFSTISYFVLIMLILLQYMYSSSLLIRKPLLPSDSVPIREVSFVKENHMHSLYLLRITCVLSGGVSRLERGHPKIVGRRSFGPNKTGPH